MVISKTLGQRVVVAGLFGMFIACQQHQSLAGDLMKKDAPLIEVTQSVVVDTNSIVVTLKYKNTTEHPVLMMEGVFGLAVRNRPIKVYDLIEPEYIVSLNGQTIRYSGPISIYVRGAGRDAFVKFNPGEKSVRMTQIANGFDFAPGQHIYEISHRHFIYDEIEGRIVEHRSKPVQFSYTKPAVVSNPESRQPR